MDANGARHLAWPRDANGESLVHGRWRQAEQIEALVGGDDAYERAQRRALALLEHGFHLGGRIEATRDEWHER